MNENTEQLNKNNMSLKNINSKNEKLTVDDIFDLVDLYFNRKYIMYSHLKNSFDKFIEDDIRTFLTNNEHTFCENFDIANEKSVKYKFEFSNIAILPPVRNSGKQYMFPSDARDNNLTYESKITATVTQIQEIKNITTNEIISRKIVDKPEDNVPIATVPILVRSKYCSLNIRKGYDTNECEYDPGCYFIVNGAEKVVISQERMCENKPLVFTKKDSNTQIYVVQVNSRTVNKMQVMTISLKTTGALTLRVPILTEFPIVLLFRALGVESDKDIIDYIVYDKNDSAMIDAIIKAIRLSTNEKGEMIRTQNDAINYLSNIIRVKKVYSNDKDIRQKQRRIHLEYLLEHDFLPHISGDKQNKVYYLGYMINKLLNCALGRCPPDDRDSSLNKRISLVGDLMDELFKQYFKKMINECNKKFKESNKNDDNPYKIINQINPTTIEQGLKTALLTGAWGKKKGVAQVLQRLTYLQAIEFFRRIDSPSNDASSSKLTHPRHLHPTQNGMLCLSGDSCVLLDNNRVELIRDMCDGFNVATVDIKNLHETSTSIKHYFSMLSESSLKITTLSGNIIKCTPDHRLMVIDDKKHIKYVPANELKIGYKLVERPMINNIPIEPTTKIIIDQLNTKCDVNKFIQDNKKDHSLTDIDLELVSRILGYSYAHEQSLNNPKIDYVFRFDTEEDIGRLQKDVNMIGFPLFNVQKISDKYVAHDNEKFIMFLNLLNINLVHTNHNNWITTCTARIRREFINGFISGSNLIDGDITKGFTCKTSSSSFAFTKNVFAMIKQLLDRFGVETYLNKSGTFDSIELCIVNTLENLIKYVELFTPVYNSKNETKMILKSEYLKYKRNMYNILDKKYITIGELINENLNDKQISDKINVPKRIISKFRALFVLLNDKEKLHACIKDDVYEFVEPYEEFLDHYLIDNNKFGIPITAIENGEPIVVYDFTTDIKTHNFIVNGVCSSNCPVETPEHAKVGLVKHMTLLGNITVATSSQLVLLSSYIKPKIKNIKDIHPSQLLGYTKVFLNGDWLGLTETPIELFKYLKELKHKGSVDYTTSIVYDDENNEVKVYCDGGRLFRPVICVNNNVLQLTKQQIEETTLNKLKNKNMITSWEEFMQKNPKTIEYIDSEEQAYSMIAQCPNDVYNMFERTEQSKQLAKTKTTTDTTNRYNELSFINYSHCEFHQSLLLGLIATNIPFSNYNQGPRNIFQYAQGRQAMCIYISNYRYRSDTSYILYHPHRPIVNTRTSKYMYNDVLSPGENAVIAIACYTGWNQEDAIVFNKSAIDRGLFRSTSYNKYVSIVQRNQSTSDVDVFMKPDPTKVSGMKHGSYDKLNDKGYVPEETEVGLNDILIAKCTPIKPSGNSKKIYKDNSETYKQHVPGVVDKVFSDKTDNNGYPMIKMSVRSERRPDIGDKFCLTKEADVLTSIGWIPINEISKDHKVACLIDNDYLEYVNPIDVYKFEYHGDMYKIRTQQVDLDVTIDHNMYVKLRNKNNFELLPAKDIIGKRVQYKKWANNNNTDKITFEGINGLHINMDAWLKFFGIWMAEGWANVYNSDNSHVSYQTTICQCKPRVSSILQQIAADMGFNTISIHGNKKDAFTISNRELAEYMKQFSVGTTNKTLPQWVWELSQRQSKLLLQYMLLGDGYTNNQGVECYYTSSVKLANDVMKLAIHSGLSGTINKVTTTCDSLCVRIIKSKNEPTMNHGHANSQHSQSEEIYKFDGEVYCLEVPSHVFMVRQNGKNVWTGNCSKHGQKGTVGLILPQSDMPFTENGLTPDAIINPNAIPSRMTIGQIIECLIGKVGAIKGHECDGTAFTDINVNAIKDELEKLGYNRNGSEYMYNGMTGKKMKSMIFVGPTFYQRLKHLVKDKSHSRSKGPRTLLLRQPSEGRARGGGMRIGEMERDALIAHGISKYIKEKLMDTSDIYSTYVCDQCGLFAQRMQKNDSKFYPLESDMFYCPSCNNKTHISKIVIPYAFKLLVQELMSMCIAPRIRTFNNKFTQ